MFSRFVIAFLPRSKCLNFMATVTICSDFKPKKIKSVTLSIVFPSICHEVMRPDAMILVFWMLSSSQHFPLSSFTFIKRLLSSSSLSAIKVVSSAYLRWQSYPCFPLITQNLINSVYILLLQSSVKLCSFVEWSLMPLLVKRILYSDSKLLL